MKTLAVDPGVKGCGCALFNGTKLVKTVYVRNEEFEGDARAYHAGTMAREIFNCFQYVDNIDVVVVEWPQIYVQSIRRGHSFADPADLLPLTAIAGGLAALYSDSDIRTVWPAQWKAQMPKDVTLNRVMKYLDEGETITLEDGMHDAKSLAHNVVDAVGIGLSYVGRWPRANWKETNERRKIR